MRIYFMTNGAAIESAEWEGEDNARPLTDKGRKRIERAAKILAPLDMDLDAILHSPFERNRQTAKIFAKTLKESEKLMPDERLQPGFGMEQLKSILADFPEAEALLLVGHQADFEQIIHTLTGAHLNLKTGGLARVDVTPETLESELTWLIPPKLLK